MRGHLVKRGRHSWSFVVDVGRDPATGKRRQQWISVKGTRKDAERKLSETLTRVESGGFVKPARLTVGEFLNRWLRDYASTNVRPRTLEGYQGVIRRHLVPSLGAIPLTELQPSHLQAYYAKVLVSGRKDRKEGGLSARSVLHHHRILSEALSHAVKWGLMVRNVASAVDPPRPVNKEMHTLDSDGVQILLESARCTMYFPLIRLAVFTGLRRSELLGLRWKDVDLDMGTLSVVQVLHRLDGRRTVFDEPKTAKGRRQVALGPAVVLALRSHKEREEAQCDHLDILVTGNRLVFCHPDGSPLLPGSVSHAFTKLVRRIGLEGVRLHDLRHTHASLMLKQGVYPKVVSERLGHATIAITLDTYSHVTPGLQQAAALRFEEGLMLSLPTGAPR